MKTIDELFKEMDQGIEEGRKELGGVAHFMESAEERSVRLNDVDGGLNEQNEWTRKLNAFMETLRESRDMEKDERKRVLTEAARVLGGPDMDFYDDGILELIRKHNADGMGLSALDEYLTESKEDRYPKTGPFYYYRNTIVAPENFQKRINPTTHIREYSESFTFPGEHRDMWDKYMVVNYPELKGLYNDDHKALPRGRVDYTVKNGKPEFFVTLDRCIKGMEQQIRNVYNLGPTYTVTFHYGVMNYTCKNCTPSQT